MSSPEAINEILGKLSSVALNNNDVVLGRGGFTNRHQGNIDYLQLLSEHEEAYMECKRKYQKLLSLCIIHQLRCKGVRFLKKDEKTGKWKTVPLSQCRLKISQRLRERAPFIKLEQMKASRGLIKTKRPITSIAATSSVSTKRIYLASVPVPPPVEVITVTDASSDEEDGTESIGFDDASFYGNDSISLRSAFESMLEGPGPLELTIDSYRNGKRYANAVIDTELPQRKRPRKVSVDEQDNYASMLLKEASLLDDISVASCDLVEDGITGFQELNGMDQLLPSPDVSAREDDILEFLQVLF